MSEFKIGQIYDQAFKKMDAKEVIDNLEAIGYAVQETSYTKNLSEEELLEKKESFSQVNIQLKDLAQQKKEAMDRFKILEKEPKEISSELLESIRYKSEQKFGKLFLIDDQEAGMMYFFDVTGYCVDARPLTKQEKQLKLRTLKSGTDE